MTPQRLLKVWQARVQPEHGEAFTVTVEAPDAEAAHEQLQTAYPNATVDEPVFRKYVRASR